MGLLLSNTRAVLSPEELHELSKNTGFTPRQIVRLYGRFSHLDKGNNYLLSREDLERIPELAINPLCSRFLDVFFSETEQVEGVNEQLINFPKFLEVLSVFRRVQHGDQSDLVERKLKCLANPRLAKILHENSDGDEVAFDLYATERNGVITGKELFHVINIMVGESEDVDMLKELVTHTLKEVSGSEDGPITYDQFKEVMREYNVGESLAVAFRS